MTICDRVPADPKASSVLETIDPATSNNVACVIGFGGGNSMEDAKMIAFLANTDQPLDDM